VLNIRGCYSVEHLSRLKDHLGIACSIVIDDICLNLVNKFRYIETRQKRTGLRPLIKLVSLGEETRVGVKIKHDI
jgi:hypothetical protein